MRFNRDELNNEVDRKNYDIVQNILENKSIEIQEMIYNIIMTESPIPQNVEKISLEKRCEEKFIWNLFEKISHEIATERGLV